MLQVFQYQFPFTRPFRTGRRSYDHRQGLILRLQHQGIAAMGEAAPLAGFSKEDLDKVTKQLKRDLPSIHHFFKEVSSTTELETYLQECGYAPSLTFALYTLGISMLAQRARQPMQRLLNPEARPTVPLNAVIGTGASAGKYKEQLARWADEGFGTLKIKAGPDAADALPALVKQIGRHHPQLHIRIDANQSWQPGTAARLLQALHRIDTDNHIEYCEEPLARPSAGQLRELQRQTSIPLALDESLAGPVPPDEGAGLVPVLILKPMVLGLRACYPRFPSGTKVVYTSSLESGVGRLMTAALAAARGTDTAHGIATGRLLETDLWSDRSFISNGSYRLPDAGTLSDLMETDLTQLPLTLIFSHDDG